MDLSLLTEVDNGTKEVEETFREDTERSREREREEMEGGR